MVLMPHWPEIAKINQIKYDLSRIEALLAVLGNPHLSLPPVIHIAGTNGKGSTVSYLKAIFNAANYKVHTYTSPHLIEFNERIELDSKKIDDQLLFELCEKVRIKSEEHNIDPSFFEAITAVAFLAFSQVKADVVLLETGLGGRLDATNVVPAPLLTIITPVSFDHMHILGDTIAKIAQEKAGIIKKNIPCIISQQSKEALDVILKRCAEQNSVAIKYLHDFSAEILPDGFNFFAQANNFNFPIRLPAPALKGQHQILNAATVVAALTLGQKIFSFTGEQICRGISSAVWPGRIQKIPQKNYSRFIHHGVQIWLDGAHNPHGAQVLANWIRAQLKEKVILIVGITKNRDVYKFLSHFDGLCSQIFTVPVLSEPVSYSSQALTELAAQNGISTTACLSLEHALTTINNNLFSGNIIITGSLFLISDFYSLMALREL